MPKLAVNGTELYYEDTGEGDRGTVVFSHGLLWDARMFDKQAEHLSNDYRVVRYDHRGQGRSARPKVRSIGIETLYDDAVALIEELDLGPCHFAGLSMGGFVAMRLAARNPDLLKSCILLETSAEPEPNAANYRLLNFIARFFGIGLVASRVMPIMFGETFMADPERADARAELKRRLTANDRSIWRAVNGVIEREGVTSELGEITVPTLIIVGEEDVATTPDRSELMDSLIPDSRLVKIPRAGHTSTVEEPAAVNAAISEFLASVDAA